MQRRPRVLVVDDEPDLVDLVSMNLTTAGYDVIHATDGLEGLHAARAEQPDLVILDVMMPEMSGVEVARRLRADPRTASTPVLMLTARASEGDQVSGLAAGADDYITKPFSMRVLLARVEAALRRAPQRPSLSLLRLGSVEVNLETHEAFTNGERASLTPTEFRLLAALLDAGGRVLNRDSLIEKGMGPGVAVTDRAIDVHVAALRKKLGANSWLIRTVRGVGYRATAEREDGMEGV